MKRAFFQNEPKLDINMLKLPLIIAPSLLGSQVNNDVEKKSLLDKTIVYKPEVFTKFTEMTQSPANVKFTYSMCHVNLILYNIFATSHPLKEISFDEKKKKQRESSL